MPKQQTLIRLNNNINSIAKYANINDLPNNKHQLIVLTTTTTTSIISLSK